MAVSDYSTTAALNTSINGVNIGERCPAPNLNNGLRELMADLAAFIANASFPSGTTMLFAQTAAPIGWTKSLAHDNKALRVVSGTASSGGTVDFTTAFASQTVAGSTDAHALTTAELAAHQHFEFANEDNAGSTPVNASQIPTVERTSGSGSINYMIQGTSTAATVGLTSSAGSGTGHSHTLTAATLDLAVKYLDCIMATKD